MSPTCVAKDGTTTMTLTIKNGSSSQSIGSFDLTAPAGFTLITSSAATPAPETSDTVLAFRNLGIAAKTSRSYTISATTSATASGTVPWTVQAKQSNDFNGPPGNDFTLTGGQPTTTIGCTLVWVVQPASAVHAQTITGQPYNPTIGHGNPAVSVKVTDGVHDVTNVSGNVSLNLVDSPTCGGFSGDGNDTSVALSNGVATFGSLQSSTVAFGCKLQADSPGFTSSAVSDPFNISLVGTLCGRTSCPSLNSDLNDEQDSGLTTSASGGPFQFMAFSPVTVGDHVGCANFDTLGVPGFDETDGNLSGTGTKTFRYFVSKVAYDKKFSDTRGQQFIPICAGGQRVVDGRRVDCNVEKAAGASGWWGKSLDEDGNLLPGLAQAQCDPDGLWWGILASFQDYNTLTPGPNGQAVDWSRNPSVTGWGSNNWSRYFDISVPSPWDWRAGT